MTTERAMELFKIKNEGGKKPELDQEEEAFWNSVIPDGGYADFPIEDLPDIEKVKQIYPDGFMDELLNSV